MFYLFVWCLLGKMILCFGGYSDSRKYGDIRGNAILTDCMHKSVLGQYDVVRKGTHSMQQQSRLAASAAVVPISQY